MIEYYLQAMKEVNVNYRAIRIWRKINCDTTIKVETHVGLSNERYVGDCVAQGNISAAMVRKKFISQLLL